MARKIVRMLGRPLVLISLLGIAMNPFAAWARKDGPLGDDSRYQVIRITDKASVRLPWSWSGRVPILNLKDLAPLVDESTEQGRVLLAYIRELSASDEEPFILESAIPREVNAGYRDYWTRKDSVLRVVGYESLGSESHTNEYLGPIASIPTDRYGVATYRLAYDGEVFDVTGPIYRKMVRSKYWSHAQVYLPRDESGGKIAIVAIRLPTNSMDYLNHHGIYAVIPKSF